MASHGLQLAEWGYRFRAVELYNHQEWQVERLMCFLVTISSQRDSAPLVIILGFLGSEVFFVSGRVPGKSSVCKVVDGCTLTTQEWLSFDFPHHPAKFYATWMAWEGRSLESG